MAGLERTHVAVGAQGTGRIEVNMVELAIDYYEDGKWYRQVLGTNNADSTVQSFKDKYDRVKVTERTHWWYNNSSSPKLNPTNN